VTGSETGLGLAGVDCDAGVGLAWVDQVVAERAAAGLRRSTPARVGSEGCIDLAGNDYLALSRHPSVVEAARSATTLWGAGATGSRLVTGTTAEHELLESALAAFTGAPAATVFSSGYLANLGAITALAPADTLIISDAQNHASIVDACRLARGRVVVVDHLDVGAVERVLRERVETRALVVTESVFSVDGEAADLVALQRLCLAHDAALMVDEAHAIGVAGPGGVGLAAAHSLAAAPNVVLTLTLSKSLGAQGGAVLGSAAVRQHLVNTARPFIFDTGLAPASAAAARRALEILVAEPNLADQVRDRARRIAGVARASGWAASEPSGAVVSLRCDAADPKSSADLAVAAAEFLRTNGFRVAVFRPPSVPDGVSRLRLAANSSLSDETIDHLGLVLSTVKEAARG